MTEDEYEEMARHILDAPEKVVTCPVGLDAEQIQRLTAALLEAIVGAADDGGLSNGEADRDSVSAFPGNETTPSPQ